MPKSLNVLKVGGSLLDFPELPQRLRNVCESLPGPVVIVAGGGTVADAVRDWDIRFQLPIQVSHDLAVHSMSLTARFVTELLPTAHLVHSLDEVRDALQESGQQRLVLDVALDVLSPAGRTALPASWDVTSDAIAAWIASQLAATRLIYVKSIPFPEVNWAEAATVGAIDPATPVLLLRLRDDCEVGWVNLRQEPQELTWISTSGL